MSFSSQWSSTLNVQGIGVTWDETAQSSAINVVKLLLVPSASEAVDVQAAPAAPNTLFPLRSDQYDGLTVAVGGGAAMPFDGPAIINRMGFKLAGSDGFSSITLSNGAAADAWIDIAVFRNA